jgi:hypothetical protein
MVHLARKQGMLVTTEAGETDASLKLPPADAASHRSAAFEQCVALVDYELKARWPRFLPEPASDPAMSGGLANSQAAYS